MSLPFTLRLHRQRPLATAVIVITLGLAIGATTVVFSLAYPIVLEPLALPDADRLVHVFEAYPRGSRYVHGSDRSFITVRPGTFDDWAQQSRFFASMAAFMTRSVVIGGGTSTDSYDSQAVTERFFQTLRTPALMGRTLAADDYRDGGRAVAVLAYDLWRTRFGADPATIGRTIPIDGAAHEIVGVMPRGFYPTLYGKPSLWTPLVFDGDLPGSRTRWGLLTVARLEAGVTLSQAQREMDVISDRLTQAYPEHYDNMCAVVAPMAGYLYGKYERFFFVLLGAVALVLLVACANTASLLLARALERDREFVIRTALGASGARIVRQALAESLALAAPGALAGLSLAAVALPAVLRLLPDGSRIPRLDEVELNGAVVLFTTAVTVLATILVGLVPAWRSLHTNMLEAMNDAARGSSVGARSARASQALIVAEVTVTFILLAGGALLLRSLSTLLHTESGLRTSQVLAMSVVVPAHAYGEYEVGGSNQRRAQLFETLEREIGALPGVVSAGLMTSLPLRQGPNPWAMHIDGRPAPPPEGSAYGGTQRMAKTGLHNHGEVSTQRVTPGYFQTFGVPLVRGRLLDHADTADRPAVAVINETAARRYFDGEDPIGRTIVIDMTSYFPQMTIVGIVADSRLNGVDKAVFPQVFWPMAQRPGSNAWLALRTAGAPAVLTGPVRERIRQLAPELAIAQTTTMEAALAESLWQPRLSAVLIGGFATLALVLAAAGIYGVFSQFVSRRTRELGVRIALGASGRNVAWLVLRRTLRLAACGVALGALGALWLGRVLAEQLHDISPADPITLAAVGLVLVAMAILATAVPLWHAARIDPAVALRES